MNLIQLEYFMQLAENGSFRKTAEKNYVSQPAVSKHISLLEKEWGFSLFNRGYRKATLTESGQIMYEALCEQRKNYTAAMELAKIKGDGFRSRVTIGIPEASECSNLPEVISSLRRENPEIAVNVKYMPLPELTVGSPKGEMDIVLCYDRNLRSGDNVEYITVSRHRHLALISGKHPLCANGIPRFEELRNERIYIPASSAEDMTVDYAKYICVQHGFHPRDVNILPNVDSVLLALKMGFGFAVLDDMVRVSESYGLVSIPTDVYFNVMLAWRREDQNPAIPICIKKLTEELEIQPKFRPKDSPLR